MGPPSERRFTLNVSRLVDAGSSGDPERLFRAVGKELEPAVELLRRHTPSIDLHGLTWILIELISNCLTAPLGKALAERTGLTRQELLDAFGTSVLWPHPSPDRIDRTAPPAVRERLESAIGRSSDEFLSVPLREKFRILGIALDEDWLSVVVRLGQAAGDFEILVESDHGPSEEDHQEILRRFEDNDGERARVIELRKKHEDHDGMYHIPSFTGGGRAGLLMCIQTAKELGLHFDYVAEEPEARKTVFRIASSPVL